MQFILHCVSSSTGFLLLGMMCVRYLIVVCEKVFIRLWMLGLAYILSSLRLLMVFMYITP